MGHLYHGYVIKKHIQKHISSWKSQWPGFANLPARMAEQASAMYAQNMANLLRHVHAKGAPEGCGDVHWGQCPAG